MRNLKTGALPLLAGLALALPAAAQPGGSAGQLQINNGAGGFGGATGFSWSSTSGGTLTMSDGSTWGPDGPVINTELNIRAQASVGVEPQLLYEGYNATWLSGIDVHNHGGGTDFFVASRMNPGGTTVTDFIYVSNNYPNNPTVGIGVTPPGQQFAMEVTAAAGEATQGSIGMGVPSGETEDVLQIYGTGGPDSNRLWGVRPSGYQHATIFQDETTPANPVLGIFNNTLSSGYGWYFDGNDLRFRSLEDGVDVWDFQSNGVVTQLTAQAFDSKVSMATSTTAAAAMNVPPSTVGPTSAVQGDVWNIGDVWKYQAAGGAEYFLMSNAPVINGAIPFGNSSGTSTGFSTAFAYQAANQRINVGEITLGSWTGVLTNDAVICSTSVACTTANYAMAISTADAVNINAATGQAVTFSVNNTAIMTVNSSGAAISKLTLTGATPTVAAGQVGLGDTTVSPGTSACPTTATFPAEKGCMAVSIAGTTRYIPYF